MATKNKMSERSITKLFLENINSDQVIPEDLPQEKDLDIEDDEKPTRKTKAYDVLEPKQNIDNGSRAVMLLSKLSKTPQTWTTIYKVIENFRNDVTKRDKFDNSANPTQVGMASVLHILFSLVVETDLLIEPIDVDIIISTFKNNFKTQEQVDALEELVNQIKNSQV